MGRKGIWPVSFALAVLLAGCATTVEVEPRPEPAGGPIVTQHALCTGGTTIHPNGSGTFDVTVSRDGTFGASPVTNTTKDVTWELYLPPDWNQWWFGLVNGGRRLVVFHQGTIDPYNPVDLPNHSFAMYNEVVCNLVASNIAVAWTSNTETGYDLEGAYRAAAPLVSAVEAHSSANPSRVYQVGFSQGGLLGPAFLENDPTLFDGALSICAPLDGMTSQLQYLGDARVLFDAYLQSNYAPGATTVLPTANELSPAFSVPEGSPPDGAKVLPWNIVPASHTDGTYDFDAFDYAPVDTANLPAGIRDLLWAQYGLSDNAALAFAGNGAIRLPAYTPDILTYSTTEVLYYAIRGVNQLLRKAGGIPYTTPGSFPAGTPNTFQYAADPAARTYVASHFDTTGNLQKPLLTLHTTDDPAVPYWHESKYRDRVAAEGKTDLLRHQWVQRVGHCALTQDEMVGALEGMIRWVEFGEEPLVGNVTSTFDASPVVAIVSPTTGATVSGSVDVQVTASDDTGVARVELRSSGVVIGSDDAPELVDGRRVWRFVWDASELPPGSYTLEAIAHEAVASLPTGPGTPRTATAHSEVQLQGGGVVAPSIEAFTASDTTVLAGADVTLEWTVTGSSPTLTLSDGRNPEVNVTGSTSWTVKPTVDTAYTLTASNDAGSVSANVAIDIGAAPSIHTFTATPSSIEKGKSSTLAWTTAGDGTLALALTWEGGREEVTGRSSTSVAPLATTVYTLTATSDFGSATSQPVTVTVTAPPSEPAPLTLGATSSKVRGQQRVDLVWTPAGVTKRVEVLRDESLVATTGNDGGYLHTTNSRGGGSYTYKVCEIDASGTRSRCSNSVTVTF